MKRNALSLVLTIALAAGVVGASTIQNRQAALVSEAKIKMAEARQIALGRVPGTIKEGRLHREDGKTVFEIEVHTANGEATEVYVDAIDRGIVKVESAGKVKNRDRLTSEARITFEQAEQASLRRVPGTIVESELERENGKIVYSLKIISADGNESEVEIDAVSGEVLEVEN